MGAVVWGGGGNPVGEEFVENAGFKDGAGENVGAWRRVITLIFVVVVMVLPFILRTHTDFASFLQHNDPDLVSLFTLKLF
jgi:hypothetical protein